VSWIKTVARKAKIIVPAAALAVSLYLPLKTSREGREGLLRGEPVEPVQREKTRVALQEIHDLTFKEIQKIDKKIVNIGGTNFVFEPASYCSKCHDLNEFSRKEQEHVLKAVKNVKKILGEDVNSKTILFLPVSPNLLSENLASFEQPSGFIRVKLPPLFGSKTEKPSAVFTSLMTHELAHQATFSTLSDSHEVWSSLTQFLSQPMDLFNVNPYSISLMRRLLGDVESNYVKEREFVERFLELSNFLERLSRVPESERNFEKQSEILIELNKLVESHYNFYEKRMTSEHWKKAKTLVRESFAEYKSNPILLDFLARKLNDHVFTPFDVTLGKKVPVDKVNKLQKHVNYFVKNFDKFSALLKVSRLFPHDINDPSLLVDAKLRLVEELTKTGLSYEDAGLVYHLGLSTLYEKLEKKPFADEYAKKHSKELEKLLSLKIRSALEIKTLLLNELEASPSFAKKHLIERMKKLDFELQELEKAKRALDNGTAPWQTN